MMTVAQGMGDCASRVLGATRSAAWLGAVLGLVVLVAGCRGRSESASRPDVVLITVDTLRADHVGVYGAELARTPFIDALAAEGALFENVASPMPETRPAHFTLFTSRYPRDHGVVSNLAFPRDGLVALPALYGAAGYRTAAFVGCGLFDERARRTLGFEHLDSPETPQRRSNAVVPRAISWLDLQDSDQPVFLWLHLFDPHMPYEPPANFDPEPLSSLAETWPDFTWPRLLESAEANAGDLPQPVLERARDLYRGEVEHVDHWLGRLAAALRKRGRWQQTLVLLTADHGECFSDGVFFDHSQCMGEGALAVPLILRLPRAVAAGRRIPTQVELLDIAPTLLRLSGLKIPEEFRGAGLMERADGASEHEPFAVFERPHYDPVDVRGRNEVLSRLRSVGGMATRPIDPAHQPIGVRSGAWKYLVDEDGERLFHLGDDPGEGRNLAVAERQRLARFRRALSKWRAEHPVPTTPEEQLLDEDRERLRSLGYF